jgi:hypothetical protein
MTCGYDHAGPIYLEGEVEHDFAFLAHEPAKLGFVKHLSAVMEHTCIHPQSGQSNILG